MMSRKYAYLAPWIAALLLASSPCFGDDATKYEITIAGDSHRSALVRASLVPAGETFYMLPGANQLPERWATFVSDVEVRDANGKPVPVAAGDDATWRLSHVPEGRVTLSYKVNLDHEQHEWSGGVDGAAYWREWGVFYTTRSLLVLNGEDRQNVEVSFLLPDQWRVSTPWESSNGEETEFRVPNQDALATSMFFAGTHKEVPLRQGPFEFLLTLGGPQIIELEDVFVGMAEGVLDYYVDLMGGVPRLSGQDAAGRPVVIINQSNVTDGEAIGNNISILIEPSGDPMSQTIARLIFAHEFFHLWNGKSFVPDGDQSEWFKEGFSNYYTLKALHQAGYLPDEAYLQVLAGLFYARYKADDGVGRLSMTDGELKHDHWGLVYSGGMLVAIAQDLQIRTATGNERGIDDLMRHLFDEYDDEPYALADIENALGELNGASQADFFQRYVRGSDEIPIAEYLLLAGIDTVEQDGRTIFAIREDSTPEQDAIRRGMFGAPDK
jgi:predicted metalloprotease with PDZ domain